MTFSKHSIFSLVLASFVLLLISCDTEDPYRIELTPPEAFSIEDAPRVDTESGLTYYVIKEGSGAEVTRRSQIRVLYTLRVNGEVLDSSYRNGMSNPTSFSNLGSVVPGFREGLIGMKEGGKRVLIVPPELGYGDNPAHDLSDDTLRFDVEVVTILY